MNLPLIISALSFAISLFSFFYFKSWLGRRTSQERILSELRDEVNVILKTINDTIDRDISLIEDREKSLKSLLEEIDKRLNLYIREMERFGNISANPVVENLVVEKPVEKPAEITYRELGKKRYSIKSQETSQSVIPEQTPEKAPAFPLPAFDIKTEAPPPAAAELPLGEQIRSLLLAGFSAPVAAARLGVSIAEVEFAAALLERRES